MHNNSERSDLHLAPGTAEAFAGRQNLMAACGDIEAKLRNRQQHRLTPNETHVVVGDQNGVCFWQYQGVT